MSLSMYINILIRPHSFTDFLMEYCRHPAGWTGEQLDGQCGHPTVRTR